jgi:threonyl-tRNA synthetase
MLQRVYGTAWEDMSQLKIYKKRLEEGKRRDHRVIGKRLDLFSIQEDAGGGLVFWHPKGAIIRRIIEDYWKSQHVAAGYDILYTPHMANLNLWKTSGHAVFYKDGMFRTMEVDEDEYQIKPMNCPFHCLMFKDKPKSYRDLPLRWAELGTVYRYERSGTLHGLFRVRGFTQDDAHIFCLPDQLEEEIVKVLDLTENILSKFGFTKFDVMLSTRPEESVGSDEIWDKATNALLGALQKKGWSHTVDEGGGAFYGKSRMHIVYIYIIYCIILYVILYASYYYVSTYLYVWHGNAYCVLGPKIDIKIQDAIGRRWQCSTIQADFNLPDRFCLEYTSPEGERERPIMLHRAIFGSIERFFGVLIESTAGDFPLWISPTHLRLLPVTDEVKDYCVEVKKMAEKRGLRVEIDNDGQRLAKQIRNAEQERIPLMAVVGVKEKESRELSIRARKVGDLGSMSVEAVLDAIESAVNQAIEFPEALKK